MEVIYQILPPIARGLEKKLKKVFRGNGRFSMWKCGSGEICKWGNMEMGMGQESGEMGK